MFCSLAAVSAASNCETVDYLIDRGVFPPSMRATMDTIREGMRETEAILPGYLDRLSQSVLMLTRDEGRVRAARMLGSGEVRVTFMPQDVAPPKADPPTPAKPALSAVARKYEREYLANQHLAAVGLSLEDYAQHRAWEDLQTAQRAKDDPATKPENWPYCEEYRANPNFAKVGLSLADYIAGRRVDDGLDLLQASATASDGNAARAVPEMLRPVAGAYEVGSELW